jgi:hypothetical protein
MITYPGPKVRRVGATVFTLALLLATIFSGPLPALAETEGALAGQGQAMAGDDGQARTHRLLTTRRALGAAFLTGSAILAMQGFELKDEADGFYESYESATDLAEIEKFYQRTTNPDVKSQVSWALAAAFGITGLRLALTGGDSEPESMQSRTFTSAATDIGTGPSMSLVPAVSHRVVGLRLQRHFY